MKAQSTMQFSVQATVKNPKTRGLRLRVALWLCYLAGMVGRTTIEVDVKQGELKWAKKRNTH